MKDIFGTALLDYYHGNYTEDLITETNISEEDELPLPYLFRNYADMPAIEQKALQLSKGKVLDVGCGAGNHALYLQDKGFAVTAIDTSEGAIKVNRLRGVKDARCISLLDLKDEKFDTILLLMNGAGIFQKVSRIYKYLKHLKDLLAKGGQILVDSSDLKYMYDEGADGGIWVPGDRYYGELTFTVHYKGQSGKPFDWLYLDEFRFEQACIANNLTFEVITRGAHFDYLARITA
jgi:SAM-dependent methyltransferase